MYAVVMYYGKSWGKKKLHVSTFMNLFSSVMSVYDITVNTIIYMLLNRRNVIITHIHHSEIANYSRACMKLIKLADIIIYVRSRLLK